MLIVISYSNSFYLATRQMIYSHSIASGPDYVQLKWSRPNFQPERYQLMHVCTLKPTCTPGHGINNYVMTKMQNLTSNTTSVTIPNLRPSSICILFLSAVYNLASIDSGITTLGTTLDEDRRKTNSGMG